MAIPKVFVSSTCYDLQEERSQLERFIYNHGFQPILSEYSGVYYDVDTHTHESCVNEVSNCDMFVLIISGRYGGKFKDGNGESITQAEYNKAREVGLPIFTFVKADVFSAQHYYKENLRIHGEVFANKISYPAIEKQSDATSIFSFIDIVHRAKTNNGIEKYQSFSDIESHLKKQWAGMFFSFLQKRKEQDKVEAMTSILEKLANSSTKLEALVSSLHNKEVGEAETSKLINNSIESSLGIEFYSILIESLSESVWNEDADDYESTIREKTESMAYTEKENDLASYLKNMENIVFIQKEDSQNTMGNHMICFSDSELAGFIPDRNWHKLVRIYKGVIKSTNFNTLHSWYEDALKEHFQL
ncbi:hypothetical protein CVS41_04250 [Aeromonas veronii]|nr:DUF4062 domain-containing protein [Aeromonas veronii]ATY76409.1 hypothetical protein CVS41_04250 [Aeromonas veronii]